MQRTNTKPTPEQLAEARAHTAQLYAAKGTRPVRVASKLAPAVVFLLQSTRGKPCALAYAGASAKPAGYYGFPTEERRRAWVEYWLADQAKHHAQHEQRKAERKASNVRRLVVGDILRSSWGYDQTNIDYYEVTALVGTSMVEVRPIARQSLETESMQGKCVPCPGQYTGEAKRYKAQGDSVKVSSYCGAYRIEPTVLPGGVKVYPADHWTAYA